MIVSFRRDPDADFRLVCFPWAGAGAAAFYRWTECLPRSVELAALRLPGRESRMHEPPFGSLAEAAAAAADALSTLDVRPTIWFGHSLGALLAFETALQLQDSSRGGPRLIVVSGAAGPTTPVPAAEDLAGEMEVVSQLDADGIDHDGLRDMILRALRADLAMARGYRARAGAVVTSPIRAYSGRSDSLSAMELNGWAAHTECWLGVRWFDGDHFLPRVDPHAVANAVVGDAALVLGARSTRASQVAGL